MTLIFCKLARPDLKIPMPGGAMFPARGETVDTDNSFIRRLIDGGDIVPAVEPGTETPDMTKSKRKA